MKKKPTKVQESPASYAAKKSTPGTSDLETGASTPRQIRYATPEQVRKSTKKIFSVHHELFRKLAQ